MRALLATFYTVLYIGSIGIVVYEMTKHDWLILALFGLLAMTITVGFWLATYERLGHR